MLHLKAVIAHNWNLARHGEAQTLISESEKSFLLALASNIKDRVHKPTWKTLNDLFKKLVSDHRDASKRNSAASGIIEIRGERELLLEDISLAVGEAVEQRRAEREEKSDIDRRLMVEGEQIRERVTSCDSQRV